MRKGIYVVWDKKAEESVGPMLQTHKHQAVAVRTFAEIVTMPDSVAAKHPEDYEFHRLGWLEEDGQTLTSDHEIIMTATMVLATQQGVNDNG